MKKEKILFIGGTILCAVAAILAYLVAINTNKNEDAIKFKEEYEKLNGTVINSDLKYPSLDISENNPIKSKNGARHFRQDVV